MSTTKQIIEMTQEQCINIGQWMLQASQLILEQEGEINELKKELATQKAISKELRGLVKEQKCNCHGSNKES